MVSGIGNGCGCAGASGAAAPAATPVPVTEVAPDAAPPASAPAIASAPAPQAPPGAPAATAAAQARAGADSLRIASFNVLGSTHTADGGSRADWSSGPERVPAMIEQLRRHQVDVAGLQEFQGDQQAAFRAARTGYAMHGERDNVVVWREDRFRLVEQSSLTIPYFKGKPRKMPVVQLEDRATGHRAWYVNIHNPADTRSNPNNGANRAEAVKREQALLDQLRATGLPVFLVGDFNDRGIRAKIHGASAADPGREAIDWVFGSDGIRFSNTTSDSSPKRDRTSDHPIVVTTAHLPGG